LTVNGGAMDLTGGDRVLIPARSLHSLENAGITSLVWLAAFRRVELPQDRYDLVGEAKLDITFSIYAEQYLKWSREHKRSFKNDQSRMAVLVEHFGSKRLCDISPMDIERFKIERRKSITRTGKPRSLSSVNRELQLLRHVFSFALRDGLIQTHPMKGKVELYREDNKIDRYLTEEEESRLLAACIGRYEHLRPIVVCALHTGMRRGEIFNLKWSNVDFKENLVHVHQPKTGKCRAIHMPVSVRIEIERLLPLAAEHEFVFGNSHTTQTKANLRGFKAVCKAAGIEGLRFHDLRHTFTTRLAQSSGNTVGVVPVLGHAQVGTTMHSVYALQDRVNGVMDRLAALKAEIVPMPTTKARVAV
jgi:integrase